ncbi:reductase [Streptomyces sp. P38-E01]|uniref:Reductase n=1 Tax=Streptomyces tardus TaxID=2780544 RepID=A0A949N3W4_9ACTN|nr:NAD-dependent epimerase/dehydratase family protein [Streptomyces tardus]MBU7600470.1 reductase [Streptomyces tardus]
MRLLILGGTDFVGRVMAEEAVAAGHEVTVLSRGTRPAPQGVRALVGDRETDDGLDALDGGEWDAVYDTWTGAPRVVRRSAALLADRVAHYAYVSTRSVYAQPTPAGADEDAPLVDAFADAGFVDYPTNKRGGELAVREFFGDRSLLLRAGLVLGRYENVGRLPWWLRRIARGGRVLAPGPRDLPLQYIDAQDLARWTLRAVDAGVGGAFNTVSPSGHATMDELLTTCVQLTGSDAELVWRTPEEIEAAGLEPWNQLPVWIPPGELHDTMHRADVSRALAAGLRCRPLRETVADTWEWLSAGPPVEFTHPRRAAGLTAREEADALAGPGS